VVKEIVIEPFVERQLNPNSYNLRLHNELLVYEERILDMKKENRAKSLIIPEDGLMLEPEILYLARTVEYTKTEGYVPMLEGHSSIGRLGCSCILPPVLVMWALPVSGPWRFSVSSQSAFIPETRSVRSTITASMASMRLIAVANTRTTKVSSRASFSGTLNKSS
jgi:deoxycytidine triphosphate deaminase